MRVPVVGVADAGGVGAIFEVRLFPAATATKGPGVSCISDIKSVDVSEDESLPLSESESDVSSDAVDGAYSCLRGEDDLLFCVLSDFLVD